MTGNALHKSPHISYKKRLKIAEKLSNVDRTALAETKKLFHEVADLPLDKALEKGRDTNKRMRGFSK